VLAGDQANEAILEDMKNEDFLATYDSHDSHRRFLRVVVCTDASPARASFFPVASDGESGRD
jgi:hypothetical protein